MTESKAVDVWQEAAGEEVTSGQQSPGPGSFQGLVTMKMISLFGLLRRAGALAQRRQFDLSELEWRVMVYTAVRPQSLTGLADLIVLDRGQLSRTVKAMVTRGLLTRERKPGGPEIVISVSEQGRALYERMVAWTIARDGVLTEGIPAEDIVRLGHLVDHMIGKARQMLEEERALVNAPPGSD